MEPLSNEQYAANKALLCPYCRTESLAYTDTNRKSGIGSIYVHVECCSCHAEFIEHYAIVGWKPFKTPPAEPKQ